MKVVLRRLCVLGLLVVFCSAFMSMTPVFVNDAYAQVSEATEEPAIADTGGATTNVGSGLKIGGKCSSQDNPFFLIACKATTTLADLRVLVYIISGFGLIAFTFGAIFGKISWKHLSQLAFGLFLVAMMAPFIEYFTGDSSNNLKFGSYLPSSDKMVNISGSGNYLKKTDCKGLKYCIDEVLQPGAGDSKDKLNEEVAKGDGAGGDGAGGDGAGTPSGGENNQDKNNDGSDKNKTNDANNKWSFKDIKGSVKSAVGAAKAGIDIINTAKVTAKDIGQQRDRIKNAMSGNNGKLGGLISSAGDIVNAGNHISESVYRMDKNLERNSKEIDQGIDGVSTGGGRRPRPTPPAPAPAPASTPAS